MPLFAPLLDEARRLAANNGTDRALQGCRGIYLQLVCRVDSKMKVRYAMYAMLVNHPVESTQ